MPHRASPSPPQGRRPHIGQSLAYLSIHVSVHLFICPSIHPPSLPEAGHPACVGLSAVMSQAKWDWHCQGQSKVWNVLASPWEAGGGIRHRVPHPCPVCPSLGLDAEGKDRVVRGVTNGSVWGACPEGHQIPQAPQLLGGAANSSPAQGSQKPGMPCSLTHEMYSVCWASVPTWEYGECPPLSHDQLAHQLLFPPPAPQLPCNRHTYSLPRSGPGDEASSGRFIPDQPRTQGGDKTLPAINISGEDKRWGTLGILDSQQRWSGGSSNLSHLKTGPGSWALGLRDRGRKDILGGEHEQRHRGDCSTPQLARRPQRSPLTPPPQDPRFLSPVPPDPPSCQPP